MLRIMRYAGAIVCALLLTLLAAAMLAGATLPFDEIVRSAVHRLAFGALTDLARLFSFVGEALVWVPATLIVGIGAGARDAWGRDSGQRVQGHLPPCSP